MANHRADGEPDQPTPTAIVQSAVGAIAGVGLFGWVAIVYVASEIFDWSGPQIFGFAVAVAILGFILMLGYRILRLVLTGRWG